MRKLDILSGLFLLFVAAGICIGSLQLDVGNLHAPGSGFFPLVTGLVLGLFAILILIQTKRAEKGTVSFWAPGANKKGILFVFVIIFIYAVLLERLGFVLTSLLFFLMVSRLVSGLSWTTSFFLSFAGSLGTYLAFKFLLHAPLPPGILERIF